MSFRFSTVADNIYLDLQKIYFLDLCFSSKFVNCKCTRGTKSVMHLRTRLVCPDIIYVSFEKVRNIFLQDFKDLSTEIGEIVEGNN